MPQYHFADDFKGNNGTGGIGSRTMPLVIPAQEDAYQQSGLSYLDFAMEKLTLAGIFG